MTMTGASTDRSDLPSPWVVRFARLMAPGGPVLDVACGSGRHARWLEARGFRVTGVDRDVDALAVCGASETVVADLESEPWPLAARRFAGVIVTNYLHRPLFPALVAALMPGGVLLYETFAVGNERFGKPRSAAFLLTAGELLDHCRTLDVVAYEDGLIDDPPTASRQRICAVRPGAVQDDGRPRRHAL